MSFLEGLCDTRLAKLADLAVGAHSAACASLILAVRTNVASDRGFIGLKATKFTLLASSLRGAIGVLACCTVCAVIGKIGSHLFRVAEAAFCAVNAAGHAGGNLVLASWAQITQGGTSNSGTEAASVASVAEVVPLLVLVLASLAMVTGSLASPGLEFANFTMLASVASTGMVLAL